MFFKMGSFKMNLKSSIFIILLVFLGLLLSTFYASALDTYYSNYYPAKNSTITITNPTISVYVKSANELDSSTVKMKLNGADVNPTFTYKGKWVTDYYGNRNYVISDRREGTINYNTANLKDGQYTVEVSITDKANLSMNDSWLFTVAAPPKFNNTYPVDKSEQVTVDKISAVVSDNDAVNWDTIKLKINNVYVDQTKLNVNRDTGEVTYNFNFPSASYTAVLEAKDTIGNTGTSSWTFVADSKAPDLVGPYDFKAGSTITDGVLKFRCELNDLVDIKDNVQLAVDGNPLNISFRYQGKTNYYGEYVITSRKMAYVNFEGMVPNGKHTLTLYSEDKLGNKITRSWDFTVAAKPEITNETPLKYGVDNLNPVISAVIKSPNGSVDPDTIVLKFDGTVVNFEYDKNTGLLTYTPSETLKNESYHTVNIAVSDLTGLTLSKEWKFYTNTYPDMSDSNSTNCKTCHAASSFTGSNGILEDVHSKTLTFKGTHSNNKCENCHTYVTVPAGCAQCHGNPDAGWVGYAPHGSTSTIKYQPKNYDPSFPIRVTENREMYDCIVCHQPGSQVKGYEGYLTTPTRLLNNHDIPELHKSSTEGCTECHAQSLTHEHARDGRTDKDGNQINCNTCHQSTDAKVVKAIADKDTSCSACHGTATHDELHVYNEMSNNCKGCHKNTLTQEHISRSLTCDTCHKSQDTKVVTAIANNDKACQSCHTVIHKNQHSECVACHENGSYANHGTNAKTSQ